MYINISYTNIYIYTHDVQDLLVAQASKARMRPISAGVASGSSLAVALKALNWLDRQPVDPWTLCQNLQSPVQFDWFAFSLGLICGALLCSLIELLLTIRWALCRAVVGASAGEEPVVRGSARSEKPLYKLL